MMWLRIWAIIITITVLGSASEPASAHWQFTKWGMTPVQIVAASKGAARELSADESAKQSVKDPYWIAKLGMPYKSGNYEFEAFFLFDASDRLACVHLKLSGSGVLPLEGDLRGKYGVPERDVDLQFGPVITWARNGDVITYMRLGEDYASIDYKPQQTENNRGL
jgi:hypothetical protein